MSGQMRRLLNPGRRKNLAGGTTLVFQVVYYEILNLPKCSSLPPPASRVPGPTLPNPLRYAREKPARVGYGPRLPIPIRITVAGRSEAPGLRQQSIRRRLSDRRHKEGSGRLGCPQVG